MNLTMPTEGRNFHKLTVKTNIYIYFSYGSPVALITPVDSLIIKADEDTKATTKSHLRYIKQRHQGLQEVSLGKIIKVANYFL